MFVLYFYISLPLRFFNVKGIICVYKCRLLSQFPLCHWQRFANFVAFYVCTLYSLWFVSIISLSFIFRFSAKYSYTQSNSYMYVFYNRRQQLNFICSWFDFRFWRRRRIHFTTNVWIVADAPALKTAPTPEPRPTIQTHECVKWGFRNYATYIECATSVNINFGLWLKRSHKLKGECILSSV